MVAGRSSSLVVLLSALLGCATSPATPVPPVPAAAAPAVPLPRSSIAAVLAHRTELALTAEQEARLGSAEASLEVEVERVMRERPVPAAPVRPPPTRSTGPGGPPPGSPGQAAFGAPGTPGTPGMSAMPGMTGSYSGGKAALTPGMGPGSAPGGPQSTPAGPRAAPSAQAQLDQQLDDLDTAAWLKVEPVLSPAQLERAREIAGDYRAARFEARRSQ
jgi:hypothetical protein